MVFLENAEQITQAAESQLLDLEVRKIKKLTRHRTNPNR